MTVMHPNVMACAGIILSTLAPQPWNSDPSRAAPAMQEKMLVWSTGLPPVPCACIRRRADSSGKPTVVDTAPATAPTPTPTMGVGLFPERREYSDLRKSCGGGGGGRECACRSFVRSFAPKKVAPCQHEIEEVSE